jgi:arsenate reductase
MTQQKVLFVCLHGAAKSVLAAADFERLARERRLPIAAESAGTEPDPEIAPRVLAALKAEGVDLTGQKPRLVTREMAAGATRVIAFGCALGVAAPEGDPESDPESSKVEQWEDVPNVSDGLPAARAAIRDHLERLLDGWSTS